MYCGCGERLMDFSTACSQLLSFIKVGKLESWTASKFMNGTHNWKINSRLVQVLTNTQTMEFKFSTCRIIGVWGETVLVEEIY